MRTIILSEIVDDTYTNSSGFVLFTMIDNSIKAGEVVKLSFKDSSPTSTSFLNSSIGELISVHGLDKFKSFVKMVELNKSQANVMRRYLVSCGLIA